MIKYDYEILTDEFAAQLSAKVTKKLNDDYELAGAPFSHHGLYAQAVEKEIYVRDSEVK